MNRREFLKYSALWAASSGIASGGCVTLSKPLKPAAPLLSPGESLLLTNCNVLNVEDGTIISPGHILIRDKHIEGVFHRSDIPRANRTLDLKGLYVIPGLINNHCHLTIPGISGVSLKLLGSIKRQIERNVEECLRHGVTTVRDMLGHAGAIEGLRKRISQNKLVGPRIVRGAAIQIDGGYFAILSLVFGARGMRIVHSQNEAQEAVDRAHKEGADFIKVFLQYNELLIPAVPLPVMSDQELSAVRYEADNFGLVTAVHHTTLEGFRRALKAGIPSLEHMPVDGEFSGADIEEFVRRGFGIVPTDSVAWALSYKRNGDPNSESPEVAEIIEDREKRLEALLDEFAEEEIKRISMKYFRKFSNPDYFDHRHLIPCPEPRSFNAAAVIGRKNLLTLVRAGALIGCGNDGGIPFLFPGMMGLEMSLLQLIGVKPKDILKMATVNNAKILRMSDKIGIIKKGALADLVVLSANPLDDIANLSRIEKVFFEGQLKYSS